MLIGLFLDWLRLVRSARARPFLLITLFLDSAFIFVFLVAIQSYLPVQHGGGAAVPGYTLAAYGAARLAAQLFGGRLIDRMGDRWGLFVGLALIVLGQGALLSAVLVPEAALPAAAIYALGSAVLWPAVYALASTLFAPEERARLTSAMTLTTGFALIMGLGLGLVLPAGFPYSAAMALALIAVALAFLSAARMPAVAGQAGSGRPHSAGSLWDLIRSALRRQRLGFAVAVLLQSSAVGALLAVFRSYGRDVLDVSFRQELVFLAPAAALGAAALFAGGVLGDRLSRRLLIGVGFLITGSAIWFLSEARIIAVVIPLAAAGGIGFGLALPSMTATTMDLSHTVGQGTLLAWFMTMEGLGHAAGPALGGWINAIGGTTAVFRMAAISFVVISPMVLLFLKGPRHSTGPAEEAPPARHELELSLLKDGA